MVRVPGRYSARMNARSSRYAGCTVSLMMPIACARRSDLSASAMPGISRNGRVKQTRLRCALGDRGERGVAPLKRYARRRKSAPQAAAHLIDLFTKVPRNVPHLCKPVAVILDAAIRAARRVAQIGPERGVGVDGHLIVTKALIGDQRFDLRAIHVVIQLLGRRELGARDRVELAQHLLPVCEAASPRSAGRLSADDPESASAESSLSGNC